MGAMLSTGVFPGTAHAVPPPTATWTGATDNNWNTTSADWNVSSPPGGNLYADGDVALFQDVPGHYTVAVGGPGSATVSPNSVIIDNDSLTGTAAFAASGGDYIFDGSGSIGGTASLSKTAGGMLTIENTTANAFSGATSVLDGTLDLQYSTAVLSNLINSNSILVLSGANLAVVGAANNPASQQFTGTSINPGASTATVVNGTGTATTELTLQSIGRTLGGTLNFVPQNAGASFSTGEPNLNGIIGGWATFNGTDWATNTGTTIGAYSAYTVNTFGANNNVEIMGNTSQSGAVNSLKFFEVTADTLTLSAPTVIGSGGILVSSALNGVAENINGAGTLAGNTRLCLKTPKTCKLW